MERPVLYIFSKKQEILLSISRYVRHIGFECKKLKHRFDPKEHTSTYFFLEEITSILDKETPETLLNAVAIIDVSDVYNDISLSLNPIIDSNETGQIVSSLILAYPEVYWIFLGTYYNKLKESLSWEKEHFVDVTEINRIIELLKRHQDGYRPLFDPSGLRTYIKETVIETEKALGRDNKSEAENDQMLSIVSECLKKRKTQSAVVIDEELPFTFLNGYIAYRTGYRCFMITSKSEMGKVLKEPNGTLQLSIEDLDIKLSDMDSGETKILRDLDVRANEENYKILDIKNRLIVTGVATNEERKKYEGRFEIIDKPYAGIFDFKKYIDKLSNPEHLESKDTIGSQNQIKNNNSSESDLPDNKKNSNDFPVSHSALNKILLIADSLISRAKKILKDAKNCQEYVLGAILSLELKELLHGKSMTTALEAIALQHQMEARAECCFLGVAHEIKTKLRFVDISKEVASIIKINDKIEPKKLAQSHNAQLEIINNIRLIFKEYEQFDEEEVCLIEIRDLRRKLHEYSTAASSKNCVKKKLKLLYIFFIERYFNWLIATRFYIPQNIVYSMIFWIFVFTGLYYCTNPLQLEAFSPDFCVSEFKPSMTIRNLCNEIHKDRYNIPLSTKRNTIFWLNELLKVPDFYDILRIKKSKTSFFKGIIVLIEETNSYRKNANYSSLSIDKQNNIKRLNRLLLEETYPLATPKSRNDNSQSSSLQRFTLRLGQSALTFFEMQDAGVIECQKNWVFNLLLFLELVIAYGHLGIFITYLYQKLSRR